MMSLASSPFLRRVLLADAAAAAAAGLLMTAAAGLLSGPLGLPVALLQAAGLLLLPFAAFIGWLATRSHMSRGAVWTVVVANAIWAVDSVLLLFSGWITPTAAGQAFIIGQALLVGLFAELEYFGLRKSQIVAA